jgi:hypothetical protein
MALAHDGLIVDVPVARRGDAHAAGAGAGRA